jgi:hypothetical protein
MFNFIIGMVFGIVVSTAGFSGIAHILDKGVESVKTQTSEMAK